jgi:A/G-specific adenine glycosylase
MQVNGFRRIVWAYYKNSGRHELPWRKTKDPYQILVSELMLQQTQVDRVIPFYKNFLSKFPTIRTLAAAPLSDVLKAWQGLGYNRRAQMLHIAAKTIAMEYGGEVPHDIATLESLPGIGPYTARAVAAFAFNQDVIFIETNIRTVLLHHLYQKRRKVRDAELIESLERFLPRGRSREWYSALMDYGSFLKRKHGARNMQSAHYVRQSIFSGSLREMRGAVLRALTRRDATYSELRKLYGKNRGTQVQRALAALHTEGLVSRDGHTYSLPR